MSYYNPEKFVLHVMSSLMRQNPALPPTAATPEKAVAKIWAAGLVLRLLLEQKDYRRMLALEALDHTSRYIMPMTDRHFDTPAFGSTRKYANDNGGYYGEAMRRAIDTEFRLVPNSQKAASWNKNSTVSLNYLVEDARVRGEMLLAAFPLTWDAIVAIATYQFSEKSGELIAVEKILVDERVSLALESEWFVLENPILDMKKQIREIAASKYAIPYDNDDDFDLVECKKHDNVEFIYVSICADDLREQNASMPNKDRNYDIPDAFPQLDIVRDGKWHLVDSIHQVGCTSGIGFYRSLTV